MLSFEGRFYSPSPFLLTFKIFQCSSSLRTKCDFNTAIISLEALQLLTNALSRSSDVLSLLSGWETHGVKMTQKPSALEGLLRGRASPFPTPTEPDLMTAPWDLGPPLAVAGDNSNSPSRAGLAPGDLSTWKLCPGSWILLNTQTCTFPSL